MLDHLEEIEKYSPYGGTLILETVKGTDNQFVTAENSVYTDCGQDRSMYSYVPKSGCPDAKQCQVLMVLRDGVNQESAETIMRELQLDELAEEKHFVLLFPNSQSGGWNYHEDRDKDDDLAFLVRCFATLPKSKGGVAGFNGMIFYLGTSPASSALLASLSAKKPIDCSAEMIGAFPDDYHMPSGLHQPQTAWVYEGNREFVSYLKSVNVPYDTEGNEYWNTVNKNIKFFATEHKLSAQEVRNAWDQMFSEARRWRNDTYGTYQCRTNFSEAGFTAHVKDSSLGVNQNFEHTWYEYIPESLRGTNDKVPLLFYFHGGNCIPLYGAEQSGWHQIAARDDFIIVYPKASTKKCWNVWDDKNEPSDFQFVMALIEHMKAVHPIDESRIYVSGFSMGSMMTNALCCAYPEIFAGGAAFNAQNFGYFRNMISTFQDLNVNSEKSCTKEEYEKVSATHILADEKKNLYDWRMPLIQCSGVLDSLGKHKWPVDSSDNPWMQTIDYWKAYNNISTVPFTANSHNETGLSSDETYYDCADQRFIHHIWYSKDEEHLPLYQFLVAKRMPHAVDLREIEIAWEFIRHYSRNSNGTLKHSR
ncbi:MAG: hypothetical protein EOM64_01880 [Erysipelotrichia bacterium]|nr:hypothetical protein [Erysipelotrichia bacterium]